MSLSVGSLFAGVGGFDGGFESAGFRVIWQIEREPFCHEVMKVRFPSATMFDDVIVANGGSREQLFASAMRQAAMSLPNTVSASARLARARASVVPRVEWMVGGFPCQDVSVAGKRGGLAGKRTGLFWEFMRLIDEVNPTGVVLENVPGLITSNGGRDFYTVLEALAERGFRRGYRILDSQYFGVAQRRRRVFIVACRRESGIDPAAVLLEPARGDGDSPSRKPARSPVASTLRGRSSRPGVNPPGRGGEDDHNLIASTAGTLGGGAYGTGRQSEDDPNLVLPDVVPCQTTCGDYSRSDGFTMIGSSGERERALTASMHKRHDDDTDTLIAATLNSVGNSGGFRTEPGEHLIASAITASTTQSLAGPGGTGVRRLTPRECERLQGFPDGWTCLCSAKGDTATCVCPDSPRYKAMGNAVTWNVAEWIARRLKGEIERVRLDRALAGTTEVAS